MLSLKALLKLIFALNAIGIIGLSFNQFYATDNLKQPGNLLGIRETKGTTTSYKFDDPYIAYYLLEKLDVFSAVKPGDIEDTNYSSSAGGFKINNRYCEEHRAYFVNHPELIFNGKLNFVNNYWSKHKLRTEVIPMVGQDLHPEVTASNRSQGYLYDMRVDANIYYTYNLFYLQRQVGKQFSCLSQASNHIPGHDKMYRKDYVGQALVDYAKTYASRPSCFNYNKFFPKTWVLKQKDQCLDFFNEFNSPKYKQLKKERKVVYFRKIGANVHEGKGVFPVNDDEEKYISEIYKGGKLCGKIKDNNLIQYNVYNLLLLENRKFHFRVYLLIASANPVIAYYHDGYLRLSLNEYDPDATDRRTFVTNMGVSKIEEERDREKTCWFWEDLHQYLVETGQVDDPNWLDNYLRPEFKKAMIHLLRMSQDAFFKKSSIYELFGLDFVMDENLKLWFIEANSMPLVNGFTKESTKLINEVLMDTFEIVMGLVRSRMKRAIDYVNYMTKQVTSRGTMHIPDLEHRRQEFKQLTQNYFEPEFKPRPENSFQKIVDDNERGVERYAGLIEQECL